MENWVPKMKKYPNDYSYYNNLWSGFVILTFPNLRRTYRNLRRYILIV